MSEEVWSSLRSWLARLVSSQEGLLKAFITDKEGVPICQVRLAIVFLIVVEEWHE